MSPTPADGLGAFDYGDSDDNGELQTIDLATGALGWPQAVSLVDGDGDHPLPGDGKVSMSGSVVTGPYGIYQFIAVNTRSGAVIWHTTDNTANCEAYSAQAFNQFVYVGAIACTSDPSSQYAVLVYDTTTADGTPQSAPLPGDCLYPDLIAPGAQTLIVSCGYGGSGESEFVTSTDGTLSLSRLQSGPDLAELDGAGDTIYAVTGSGSGDRNEIVAVSPDGQIRSTVFQVATTQFLAILGADASGLAVVSAGEGPGANSLDDVELSDGRVTQSTALAPDVADFYAESSVDDTQQGPYIVAATSGAPGKDQLDVLKLPAGYPQSSASS